MFIKYRAEIDGLRALAVIPVIFFHAEYGIFGGGFVGVDVFFVISGYLITNIIIRELNNNTFSIKKFYERRARRILPALIFVILISSIIAFIFLSPSALASYFKSVIATLLFFSNLYFYKTNPYFESESQLEPLLHTWSLSIEEQFYIIFPITLFLFHKFFKRYIFLMLIFGFVASLFICQFLALKTGGTLNFYFTFSRVWELALGAMCAHVLIYKNLSYSTLIKNLLSTIGIILIVFSIFFFSIQTVFPSFYTLVPTIGTSLIILFADRDTFINKILSIKFLVSVGLISYSLYLWHQPLLAFGKIYYENFSNYSKLFVLFFSFLLSIFSYNFIEINFRSKNKINFSVFLRYIIFFFIALLLISQLIINFFGKKNNSEILLAKLLIDNGAIFSTQIDERKFIKNRITIENLDPKYIIVGSSRLLQFPSNSLGKNFINLSVGGASIEDQIAITEMALEKFNPSTVFLGADPWLFNKFSNQKRWKSISKEYELAIHNIDKKFDQKKLLNLNILKNDFNYYEKILNNIYTFLNIRKLAVNLNEKDNLIYNKNILLRNGKLLFAEKDDQNRGKNKLIKYSMYKYEFSEDYLQIYKKFIFHLINYHKKKVVLVLSPYHPQSYKLTLKSTPVYIDIENNFRKLSKEIGIEIIGSYDAELLKCNENEFIDYMHPKESCMNKLIYEIK